VAFARTLLPSSAKPRWFHHRSSTWRERPPQRCPDRDSSSSAALYGDAVGDMTANAVGGDDSLTLTITGSGGTVGPTLVIGDAGHSMTGAAQGGDDALTVHIGAGLSPEVVLIGDAGTLMTDSAHGGDNILTVTGGDPNSPLGATLIGDAPTMSVAAHGGNDVLTGGRGNDFLFGDAQNYNPALLGLITGGKDILDGGAGNSWPRACRIESRHAYNA
jgi:Ca2+-binding RTX toxin-like protein